MNLSTYIAIRNAAQKALHAYRTCTEHQEFDRAEAADAAALARADEVQGAIDTITRPETWHAAARAGAGQRRLDAIEGAYRPMVPATLWREQQEATDRRAATWRRYLEAADVLAESAAAKVYIAAQRAEKETRPLIAAVLTRNADVRRAAVGTGLRIEARMYWDGTIAWYEIC